MGGGKGWTDRVERVENGLGLLGGARHSVGVLLLTSVERSSHVPSRVVVRHHRVRRAWGAGACVRHLGDVAETIDRVSRLEAVAVDLAQAVAWWGVAIAGRQIEVAGCARTLGLGRTVQPEQSVIEVSARKRP